VLTAILMVVVILLDKLVGFGGLPRFFFGVKVFIESAEFINDDTKDMEI